MNGENKLVISNKKPWFYPILKLFFPKANFDGTEERNGTVIVFGNKIYTKFPISEPLYIHEATHCKQQNYSFWGGVKWWWKYVRSPEYRLKQELEAYRNQYECFKNLEKDREKRNQYAILLAKDCAGELYKNMGGYNTILNFIKNG